MGRRSSLRPMRGLDPWPGFTDVLAGLLLIFVFVVTFFTITETILSRTLTKKDTELDRLQKQITIKTDEIEKLSREIDRLEQLFGAQIQKTTRLEELLQGLRHELEQALASLVEKTRLVDEKEKAAADLRRDLEIARAEVGRHSAQLEEKERSLEQQRVEIGTLLAQIREKSSLLQEQEKGLSGMRLELDQAGRKLEDTEGEVRQKTDKLTELQAKIEALNQTIAALNGRITQYVNEVGQLNRMLAESKESEQVQSTKATALQKEITTLNTKLNDISSKLAAAEKKQGREFRISQLVDLIGSKDKEIDRLRKLAKYRSEFLAKFERVFEGVPDIRVQGDRFVFQSEILFASGKADVNDTGKKELDKFIKIYQEMAPKVPKDLDVVILVQGHTDDVPIRSGRYLSNWELASARATEVVRYLVEKGVPPNRVGAASFGEFHPVDQKSTDRARRLNRRIEIKITTL